MSTAGRLAEPQVEAMFDRIASVYDLMNSVMTAGMHQRWRERAVDLCHTPLRAVDVATGTGDLAIALRDRGAAVVGVDFAEKMLEIARQKAPDIDFRSGNALALEFADDEFDAATVGFGARNFDDLQRGLSEMARVVKPGGRVVVLEITNPQKPPLSTFFHFWFDSVVPMIGRFAGDPDAYEYLPNSVKRFPGPQDLAGRMVAAGMTDVRWILAAGGKRLRPVLVFVCAGSAESTELVRAGAAVELLHMATLVHDDVLDRAPMRRGRPTVFWSAGRGAATATGDFLFSRAFAQLAATGSAAAVRALSDASSSLARGELMQREDAFGTGVTEQRYFERCTLKTGKLFEAACRLGAVLGDPGEESADALGRFVDRIGLAFQVFDDVLDLSGPPDQTGKSRGTDLLDGTVTLPVIYAREEDPALAEARPRSATEAEALCDRIGATRALERARERGVEVVAEAKGILPAIQLSDSQRRALKLVADGVVERYS